LSYDVSGGYIQTNQLDWESRIGEIEKEVSGKNSENVVYILAKVLINAVGKEGRRV
jgi:hypothetical protein